MCTVRRGSVQEEPLASPCIVVIGTFHLSKGEVDVWFVRAFVVGLCGFLVWQVRGREGQAEEEGAGAGGGRSEEDGRKEGRSEADRG